MIAQSKPSTSRLPLRVVVFHARADRHHLFAFQQAIKFQRGAVDIQLTPVCIPSSPLCRTSISNFLLGNADAVVFLLSPRYFAEHPDWAAQLESAESTGPLTVHAVVAESVDLHRTGFSSVAAKLASNARYCDPCGDWPRMLKLTSELVDLLVPPKPVREVLCMFADPQYGTGDALALHREWRHIDEVNRQAGSPLALEPCWAARLHDLQDALLDPPRDVLHFSGHGEPGGLCFETADGNPHIVEVDRLVRILANHKPRCLVFNACHSADMLDSARGRVPHVIAMQGSTLDSAAIEFSRAFYAALARGKPVPEAFAHAFDGVSLHGYDEQCRPRLVN